jgi:uncharacterized membrane protein
MNASAKEDVLMTFSGPPGGRRPGPWPHPPAFVFALFLLLVVVFACVGVRLVNTAFTLAGLSPALAGVVLLASLLGSAINIPVARLTSLAPPVSAQQVRWLGVTYVVPVRTSPDVRVAVNVGGAVIPTAVSIFLVIHTRLWPAMLLATVVTAALVHLVARPVGGIGIAVPTLIPAIAAGLVTLLLRTGANAFAVAYVAGSIGTLVGADLTNMKWVRSLGAPQVSIGGAGTFDGVFVSGVLAVIVASLFA